MRKVTENIVRAFLNRRERTISNSYTDGDTLYLHNNPIARHTPRGIEVKTAGWNTVTTKERLNGIPGCFVYSHEGYLMLGGRVWMDHGEWTPVDNPDGLSGVPKMYAVDTQDTLAIKRALNREGYEYSVDEYPHSGFSHFYVVGDGRAVSPLIKRILNRRAANRDRDAKRLARRQQVAANRRESLRHRDGKWAVG